MSFQNCGVEFHGSPQSVLYSGRQITGAFYIRQPEAKTIQGLYFKITGKTNTHWSESHGSGKNRKTVHYSGHESHIDIGPVNLLAGYPVENRGVVIGSGLNTFNFSFTLPQGIPSSFDGFYGETKYKMKVTAERANKFDKSKKFPFTVIGSSDLNLNLMNRMPVKEVARKDFSSFFSDQGSLEMIIDLPMKGYIPGQQLPIKCLVKNNSRIFIGSVKFCLKRNVTYFATNSYSHSATKTEKSKIVEFVGEHVDKDSESLLQVSLGIPAIPPSTLNEAIINIQYFVKVEAVATGMHYNLDTKIPVTIGTIPVYTQTTVAAFNRPHIVVPSTANYPSCPDLSQFPSRTNLASFRSGVPPYRSTQFPPLPNSQLQNPQFLPLPNSQLPQYRSLHVLPTPSAPPQYSDMEKAQDSGLPTYEEAQILAKTTKNDPDD